MKRFLLASVVILAGIGGLLVLRQHQADGKSVASAPKALPVRVMTAAQISHNERGHFR